MMMCQVKCSELRDYWRPKSFTFNASIAELFTYERFSALVRNLHFANNAAREDGGDQPTAEEKEANPKLRNWKVAKVSAPARVPAALRRVRSRRARSRVPGRAAAQSLSSS